MSLQEQSPLFATPAAQSRLDRYIVSILPEDPKLRTWLHSDFYSVWTACTPSGDAPYVLWRGQGKGVMRVPMGDSLLHRIPPRVPHHIAGLFGYWRVSPTDTFLMYAERDGHRHYALIAARPTEGDTICWICPRCAEQFQARQTHDARGIAWLGDEGIVRDFNASDEARRCPSCGAVHPRAYGFDQPEEAGEERW